MTKSFLKLDLINCVEFMIASLFIWFSIYDADKTAGKDLNMDYY